MNSFRLKGNLVLCVFLFVEGNMHVCAQYHNVRSNQQPVCINNPCPVCCNCEADICRGDCKDGYHGRLCKNKCPDNCITCKDHSDNINYSGYANCTQCKDGYYVTSERYQCQLPCPSGCKVCTSNANCSECIPGFYGNSCDKTCSVMCLYNVCDQLKGSCMYGCKNNKFGVKENCSRDCPANCLTETCEESSGKCYDCTKNFIGHFCELCVPGQYGPDCMDICPGGCTDRICDRTTGHCASCLPSQYGPLCDQMCPENCLNGSCHQLEHFCLQGCVQGYYGKKCDTEMLSPAPTSSPYTSFQISTIILSTALGFLSGVILALWFLRKTN